jgi:hypothetical protein
MKSVSVVMETFPLRGEPLALATVEIAIVHTLMPLARMFRSVRGMVDIVAGSGEMTIGELTIVEVV